MIHSRRIIAQYFYPNLLMCKCLTLNILVMKKSYVLFLVVIIASALAVNHVLKKVQNQEEIKIVDTGYTGDNSQQQLFDSSL